MPLIAYNVNLATRDVAIAQKIAEAVRFRSGGLRFVKALGFDLRDRGLVQVSMNLTNYLKSPIYRVFEMIEQEAKYHGVSIVESEIVGLIPADALYGTADRVLRLANFKPSQVLENRLAEAMTGGGAGAEGPAAPDGAASGVLLDRVAAGTPTPGGGSAAAFAAALAAALGCMVANLTLGKKKYAPVASDMTEALRACESLRARLERRVEEDAAAFDAVLAARRMPQTTPDEIAARDAAMAQADRRATDVPMAVLGDCESLTAPLASVLEKGNPNSATDAGVAAALVAAAARGASFNVRVNLPSLDEGTRRELARRADQHLKNTLDATERILASVERKLAAG
jgi:glutamate formiminotransferase/formiminotetrahydrofolate cyclodeaminase